MNRPTPAQLETARRMLELEASPPPSAPTGTAAARVYDKLQARMAPLIGEGGVHLLLVRSARLAQTGVSRLAESPTFERAAGLRETLNAQDPGITPEAAAALFGTFVALVTTLIGERLTTEILRTAWPSLQVPQGKPPHG